METAVIQDVLRKKPDIGVIKNRQHVRTPNGSGFIESDHRENEKR